MRRFLAGGERTQVPRRPRGHPVSRTPALAGGGTPRRLDHPSRSLAVVVAGSHRSVHRVCAISHGSLPDLPVL